MEIGRGILVMTLYLETPSGFTPWAGEAIGEGEEAVHYPLHVEQLWSAQELAAIGLYLPAEADPVPDGKVVTGTTIERVNGVVSYVHTLADAPYPTVDEVVFERERRLAAGFDHDLGDERGIHHIGTTPDDMRKWVDEVTPISQAMINAGLSDSGIGISTDTGPVEVTAMEWQLILIAAGQQRQPIYQASFALQGMSPVPRDFANDSYWTP